MNPSIHQAAPDDSAVVAQLVFALLTDLVGHKRSIDLNELQNTAWRLLSADEGFYAFLCRDGQEPVGVITLSQSAALYAGGIFGVIEELYVKPEYRSQSIGKRLLDCAIEFASSQDWPRLEVSTPEGDKWRRTVEFYRREGFCGNSAGERLKIEI